MLEKKIEETGNIFNRNSETSIDFNDDKKKSLLGSSNILNNISNINSKENEITTNFGEFVLMMDNKDEYRKSVIKKGKKKVWKVINKIKGVKDIKKIYNDPSLTKWYIINPDQNKCKPIFDSLFCLLLYIDFFLSPFEFFVYESDYKYKRMVIFDSFFALEILSHFFISYYDSTI